jgi:flagellar protein FliO/FliZ
MTRSMTLMRAARRAALPAHGTPLLGSATLAPATLAVVLLVDALIGAGPALAFKPTSTQGGEATPLNLSPTGGSTHTNSGGASITRTIVGLLIVIAVIWGLTWILKQVRSGRELSASGSGLHSLATLPLGSGRAMHLVRAGSDYLLVGSAEHGVAPIHRYTEQQARDAGLLDLVERQGQEGSDSGSAATAARERVLAALARARSQGGAARAPITREARQPPIASGRERPPIAHEETRPPTSPLDRLRRWTVRQ